MNLFIAEDEAPARDRLIEAIARVAPAARIAGTAASVREAEAWLARHDPPDLMLLDIQLADGLSLELFRDARLGSPVIFTTAFDQFVLDAFQAQAIDYLLKPIDEQKLAQVFAKYGRMQRHFLAGAAAGAAADLRALAERLASPPAAPSPTPAWRERVVGSKGTQFFTVPVAQVAYFVSDGKLSFLVTREAQRYLVDGPLADIERDLDPRGFFRVNRQYLVNAAAIVRFAAAGRGRLDLELSPRADGEVRVSQERAGAFRAWVGR